MTKNIRFSLFGIIWIAMGVLNIFVMRWADIVGQMTPDVQWIIGEGLYGYIISIIVGPATFPFTAMATYEILGGTSAIIELLMLPIGLLVAIVTVYILTKRLLPPSIATPNN